MPVAAGASGSGISTTNAPMVEAVEAIALQAGFALPPGTIAALFDAIDVTELGPWAAMARLGLVMAQADWADCVPDRGGNA